MKTKVLLVALVAIIAAIFGAYVRNPSLFGTNLAQSTNQKLPDMVLATLDGKPFDLKQWQGQVVVLNFWATWCPPCREEMPEFSRASQKLKGNAVQFAGIGIDTPDNMLVFQKTTPVSYPLLVGSYDTLKLTADLGNKSLSLPFTLIVNKQGMVALAHQGKLSEAELEQQLAPLIAGK